MGDAGDEAAKGGHLLLQDHLILGPPQLAKNFLQFRVLLAELACALLDA